MMDPQQPSATPASVPVDSQSWGSTELERMIGNEPCKVDEKGRIVIPRKFRAGLTTHFCMTLNWDRSIVAFPWLRWLRLVEQLEMQRRSPEADDAVRFAVMRTQMFATEIQADTWRILIPSLLREKACISGEVVVSGESDRMIIRSIAATDELMTKLDSEETQAAARIIL